jgi:hypothetical protein
VFRLGRQQADRKPNSTISAVFEKFDELQRLVEAHEVQVWVKAESAVLGEFTFKLFDRVCEADPANGVRAPHLLPGFHASNLLCELIEAYRALDWPRISVLVHSAYSKNEGGPPFLSPSIEVVTS